jgi:hypothetical protein
MSNIIPIKYKQTLTNIYILIGVLCSIIFLIGGYLLNDYLILTYTLVAILPIYVGYKMKTNKYAEASISEIKVYGLLGQLRKHYQLQPQEKFVIKSNRVYIKQPNKLIKVKMYSWFVNQYDWQSVLCLFGNSDFEKITKHLIDD